MDRGAWRTTVRGGHTELDATDVILVPGAFVSTPSPRDLCVPETCLLWMGRGLCGQGPPEEWLEEGKPGAGRQRKQNWS